MTTELMLWDKFENLLNTLIKKEGWYPYQDRYDVAYIYNPEWQAYIELWWLWEYEDMPVKKLSIDDLIFWKSWFMDCLERKELDSETNYILLDWMPLYTCNKEYHLMKLSLMSTIIEKIIYILSSIKND